MTVLIVCSAVAILVWSLVGRRLQHWHVSGPVAIVVAGIAVGFFMQDRLSAELNTVLAERLVELILAILLFVDATEVRGGFAAGEKSRVLRLLLIALPVSVVATVAVGLPLLGTSAFAVLAIACVVLPLDFAPAAELLRDRRLPRGMRHALAVESGYNDGIFSPVFAFALLVLDLPGESGDPFAALEGAVPAAGYAIAFGVGIGLVTGWLARACQKRAWEAENGIRIVMVLIPLITYAAATSVGGNGFVAAFLAGLGYKFARTGSGKGKTEILHGELSLVDDIGILTSFFMWFVFGAVASLIFTTPVQWPWVLFALLALTVLRFVPVYLAFLGSRVSFREQTALGLAGPRGTSSIVFGLLAYNAMRDDDANTALYVLVVTVLGSLVLHGYLGLRLTRLLVGRPATSEDPVASPAG